MSEPYLLKPDRKFVESVVKGGGKDVKKCYQCATCSVVCELSQDRRPFPRKEMIWAQWGLKDRLLADPDVWMCYQCNDCSTHCPRGARPGDVMGAVRREGVIHYAVPRFLGRWMSSPKYLPLLILIPVVLLGLAILLRGPIEKTLGFTTGPGETIVYSYFHMLPHWLLISFFLSFSILALLAMVAGVTKFWRAMKTADARDGITEPAKGLGQSIVAALKNVIFHNDFTQCTTERPRSLSHLCVFYGFIALFLVAVWVVTLRINPLITYRFAYPFSFWNPWRMIANIGGAAVIAGCLLMVWERFKKQDKVGSSYFDLFFIGTLFMVVATGFASEFLHYARLTPHRYAVYFTHLVCAFALLMYLPYSKFAHFLYRTTAMVYAEYSGRKGEGAVPVAVKPADSEAGEGSI